MIGDREESDHGVVERDENGGAASTGVFLERGGECGALRCGQFGDIRSKECGAAHRDFAAVPGGDYAAARFGTSAIGVCRERELVGACRFEDRRGERALGAGFGECSPARNIGGGAFGAARGARARVAAGGGEGGGG